MKAIYDETNLRLECGPHIGRGGEGDVFQLRQSAAHCAKIYHAGPLPAEKTQKLRALRALAAPPSDLQQVAAIPLSLVFEKPGGRDPVGVVLPFVEGRDIHELYSPVARQQFFPGAHLGFLTAVARNLAFAFHKLHAHGIVMGDVNEQNIKVRPDATVRLIDCDSFQVSSPAGFFPCRVGSALWTAPELVGRALGNAPRTPNQDGFGLAQMIFLLLFAGRYPFAGTPLPGVDLDPNQAIARFAFAYDPAPPTPLLRPPPCTVRLSDFPPRISALFLRAFRVEGVQPGARPSPAEWIAALAALQGELAACTRYRSHVFWRDAPGCPWCRILAGSGADLFPEPFDPGATGAGTMGAPLWPADTFQHPVLVFAPVPDALLHEARLAARTDPGTGLDWISSALSRLNLFRRFASEHRLQELRRETSTLELAIQAAEATLQRMNQRLREGLQEIQSKAEFAGRLLQMGGALQRASRAAALAEAERRVRESALMEDLREADLDEADIPGIGAGRKQTLRCHGIHTAADLREDRLRGLPGFGAGLIRRLLEWRGEIEAEFQFLGLSGQRKQIEQVADEILRRQGAEARQRVAECIQAARQLKEAQRAEFCLLQETYQKHVLKREVLAVRIEALS
jgi:DNA-binding helix-hairpin-helix protein with protein kinase domain